MAADRIVRVAALACVLALGAAGCSAANRTSPARVSTSPGQNTAEATGRATTTPTTTSTQKKLKTPGIPAATVHPRTGSVTKVLVFVEENHSLGQMRSDMPYAFGLARRFGYATGYQAVSHPSLPNYLAIAGGQTFGVTNDDYPVANPVRGTSVFGQAVASGRTAALYAEGMPRNCATDNGGANASASRYAVKHNPWAYFVNERAGCQKYDLPIGRLSGAIAQGTLPNVGMVIPNLCHDAHDCSLATADTWFKGWMTRIFASPDWKSGHLAVVLTADEDDRSEGNTVLTVVIHPSQKAHVVTTLLTHYSLTRLYEEAAGLPFLSGAAKAPSMATAFGLPTQ